MKAKLKAEMKTRSKTKVEVDLSKLTFQKPSSQEAQAKKDPILKGFVIKSIKVLHLFR